MPQVILEAPWNIDFPAWHGAGAMLAQNVSRLSLSHTVVSRSGDSGELGKRNFVSIVSGSSRITRDPHSFCNGLSSDLSSYACIGESPDRICHDHMDTVRLMAEGLVSVPTGCSCAGHQIYHGKPISNKCDPVTQDTRGKFVSPSSLTMQCACARITFVVVHNPVPFGIVFISNLEATRP